MRIAFRFDGDEIDVVPSGGNVSRYRCGVDFRCGKARGGRDDLKFPFEFG